MGLDPPYRLDPFQNIVNINWSGSSFSFLIFAQFSWHWPEEPPFPTNPHVQLSAAGSTFVGPGDVKTWPDFPQQDFFDPGNAWEPRGAPNKDNWVPVFDASIQRVGTDVTLSLNGNDGPVWTKQFDFSTWTLDTSAGSQNGFWVVDHCLLPAPGLVYYLGGGGGNAGTGVLVVFKQQ